ncbi:MAG: hypothetical protein K2W95_19845 [Candidatus Obscuribacterales bacterium]|nr:hypothetical protein [Candidatus Obscuribacterales bacterium]
MEIPGTRATAGATSADNDKLLESHEALEEDVQKATTIATTIATILSLTTLAAAADTSAPASGELTLFGGVTHSTAVPHAEKTISAHKEKLAKLKALAATAAPQPSNPAPHAVPPPSLKVEAASNVSAPPSATVKPKELLPLQKEVPTPAYESSFGVARTVSEPQHPVLKAEAAQQHYTVQWFMIPPWMAGAWLKDGDLTTQVTNLRTGRTTPTNTWTDNRLEAIWGHQTDPQGNYWHVNLLPSERDGLSGAKRVRFLAVSQNCERTTATDLLTRTHYVVTESAEWNGRALDTFQQESLNHYSMSAPNELLNSSSNRVFTYEGQPLRDGQLQSKFRKIGNFKATEYLGGINLRDSLRDYLQSLRGPR